MQTAKGKWLEVQPHAYVTRSKYFARLKEYFNLFDRNQILVLKSEDLSLFPHENLNENKAMKNSIKLFKDVVKSGYNKIHIDTGIKLKNDKILSKKK